MRMALQFLRRRFASIVPAGSQAAGAPEGLPAFFPNLIRWLVFASAFLVPLAAAPFTADPLFAKVALIQALAVIIGTAWLLQVLAARRVSYKRMPLNAAFLAVALVLLFSTVTAAAPWSSWACRSAGR